MQIKLYPHGSLKPLKRPTTAEDYMDGAKAAAAFLDMCAVESKDGMYWDTGSEDPQLNLYLGSAGIVLFLLELWRLCGEKQYLEKAQKGCDYIIHAIGEFTDVHQITGKNVHPYNAENVNSLHYGYSGIAFALLKMGQWSGIETYKEAAYLLTEQIAGSAKKDEHGVYWTGYSSITHDAGVILYLLEAAKAFGNESWLLLASEAGKSILRSGKDQGDGAVCYGDVYDSLNLFSENRANQVLWINFGSGCCGTVYTLAKLYEETGIEEFRNGAEAGARFLMQAADKMEQGLLIPLEWPRSKQPVYYLGYCNGPVGSARLFMLLEKLTKKACYKQFYEALYAGMESLRAPEYRSPGYWNTYSQCCGTAGLVSGYLGGFEYLKDANYLRLAKRAADILLSAANYDGKAASWTSAAMRMDPDAGAQEPGYMRGAAGIGAALLQMYAVQKNAGGIIHLPDDPYTIGG